MSEVFRTQNSGRRIIYIYGEDKKIMLWWSQSYSMACMFCGRCANTNITAGWETGCTSYQQRLLIVEPFINFRPCSKMSGISIRNRRFFLLQSNQCLPLDAFTWRRSAQNEDAGKKFLGRLKYDIIYIYIHFVNNFFPFFVLFKLIILRFSLVHRHILNHNTTCYTTMNLTLW